MEEGMSIEGMSNVQPFAFEQVRHMGEQKVIELFLSQLEHPGVRKVDHELADTIINFSGNGKERDDPLKQLSRDRVREINGATALPSHTTWDELIDSNHENYDSLFTEITLRLRQVRDSEDHQDIRQALFVLRDTLLTSYRLEIDVSHTIEQMVAFLSANLEDY